MLSSIFETIFHVVKQTTNGDAKCSHAGRIATRSTFGPVLPNGHAGVDCSKAVVLPSPEPGSHAVVPSGLYVPDALLPGCRSDPSKHKEFQEPSLPARQWAVRRDPHSRQSRTGQP